MMACDWAASGFGFSADDAVRIDAHAGAIVAAAAMYGVAGDATTLLGLCWVESRFVATARSSAGARGLLQLMPATWAAMRDALGMPKNADPFAPASNIAAGVYLFARLRARWVQIEPTLAAYNAGSGNVQRKGWQPWRSYVDAVLEAAARFAGAQAWCDGSGPRGSSSTPPPARPSSTPGRSSSGGSGLPLTLVLLAMRVLADEL
jgi:hypothetical protein